MCKIRRPLCWKRICDIIATVEGRTVDQVMSCKGRSKVRDQLLHKIALNRKNFH